MDMVTVVAWMGQKIELLRTLIAKAPIEKAAYYFGLVSRITRVREGIIAEAEKYTHFYDGTDLVIMPIRPPDVIRDRLFDCHKLVLMSASLYKGDIQLLTNKPYKYLELDSPIPEERRRIYIDPAPERIGFNTSPEVVVAWIKRILAKYPHRNTIVHLSYSWSAKLKPFFPGCLTNTPESKNRVLSKFKKNGGLWLASGVAEGVDLIDDVCGLNLIPILPRANITDAIVRRRLSLPGGSREYDIDIIRTVQQQAGRASRHAEDFSTTVIADPTFWGLVQQYKDELPKSFVNQIRRV
jgi:Rad3-related DNA helicase